MNKTAIKNFSTYSRRKLIESTKDKCKTIGITEDAIESPVSSSDDFEIYNCYGVETTLDINQIKQRNSLIKEINDKSFDQVIEEVAYTWFNRLIAVRFMEVNNYLPSRQRVLSSIEDARIESDLMRSPNESDIDFTSDELNYVYDLKEQNNTNELFKFLFIKECNKLNEYLPELFEKTDDYTELLFNISFDDKDDVVYKLVHDIEESNFDIKQEGQVEIIGWFYQYYNSELKDETMEKLKKTKSNKNDIPAITQLFTPDWIVKYMVENSLGRLWYEGHPSDIKDSWRYYVDEAQQEESVQQQLNEIRKEYSMLNIEDIKLIDPCMGSGHILVYAFDVFMQIYLEQGYSERNATKTILENNIYGLDIDKRAYQLSYFALMMKARQYNRRIFNSPINLHLCEIKESPKISSIDIFGKCGEQKDIALRLYSSFINAKEYGSIIEPNVTLEELDQLALTLEDIRNTSYENIVDAIENAELVDVLQQLVLQARVLITKYDVVVTNPPYMTPTPIQKKYVEKRYSNSKSDLFAIMMEKCSELLKQNGFQAMITMQSWMFLSSFEKLRTNILNNSTIINMLHLGARAFDEIGGEVVQVTTYIQTNQFTNHYYGTYFRLLDGKSEYEKEIMFLNKENKFNQVSAYNFNKIPGSPIAYWVGKNTLKTFDHYNLSHYTKARRGLETGNNDKYLKLWYEVKKLILPLDIMISKPLTNHGFHITKVVIIDVGMETIIMLYGLKTMAKILKKVEP
ncbi:MAG: BREX-1 system adenine-specific DNA-methyltransferase PglX [Erysipelotrichaceae bacterium]|nr:BREX-1 system adenine-specific DNA-methyltransferase PglX [Erysipelotrichaceae bacterium]